MSLKTKQYQLKSLCPMLVHNGALANPLGYYTKELKKITAKRKKTDADYEQMAKIEFMGGLYMGQNGPIIPANCISAMLVNAAKKFKEGPTAKIAVFCDHHMKLEYDGPKAAEELWADEKFRDFSPVIVNRARIFRTRPKFEEWKGDITLQIDDELVNPSRVIEWLTVGGKQIGLGDWRPQHGRFTVAEL